MKIQLNIIIIGILGLVVGIFINCSYYEETAPNAENLITVGWDYFEDSDYQMAYTKFANAIDANSKSSDAYLGRAWSSLLLSNADKAISDFNSSIYYGNSGLDPLAGLAIAYHANQNYSSAISKILLVLSTNSNYYFEHKPLVNYRDLHLILAMAYFHTGNLSKSYEQIRILDSTIVVSQNDPSSWNFNDQAYNSYAETLMAIIDYLDVLYGM